MQSQSLTVGVWTELTDLSTVPVASFFMDMSSGTAIATPSVTTPRTSASGYALSDGHNNFLMADGRTCWLKLTSGTGTVYWDDTDVVYNLSVSDVTSGTPTVSLPSVSVPEPP